MYKTFLLASSFLFAGAAANHAHAQEPANLHEHITELVKYHDSGEYKQDLRTVVSEARKYLALRITENAQKGKKQKLAIVLDIDETTLTNFPYMKVHSFGGTIKDFDNNILKHNLLPIKPMLELYNFAKQNKVAVFFVTGRKPYQRLATHLNLKNAGYSNWQKIYFKPQTYSQKSVIPYKSGIRRQIAAKGYTIVESIGDQHSDLKGGYAEKTFKLPNPYYYIP